jgi:CRP/FNR family transcriptional regulator
MEAIAADPVTSFRSSSATRLGKPALRDVSRPEPLCPKSTQQQICMPFGLETEAFQVFDRLVGARARLHKGETLFRDGDRFTALYAIHSGSCKTVLLTEDGHDQISGYHMPGDIIGTDGIGTDRHECQAIALEDTEVCALPFERVEELARNDGRFQHSLHRLLAREIARERYIMLILGAMRAEQRVAAFLLDLSRRYRLRGYSPTEFVLRMTRDEIGSYLGLTLETVSRVFSHLQAQGAIEVEKKAVKLVNPAALRAMMNERE